MLAFVPDTKEGNMVNEKPKMERYQKILTVISTIILVVACVFHVLQFADILPSGYSSIFLGLSMILYCCVQWKQRPISNTVSIGLWCLVIGLTVGLMAFR